MFRHLCFPSLLQLNQRQTKNAPWQMGYLHTPPGWVSIPTLPTGIGSMPPLHYKHK